MGFAPAVVNGFLDLANDLRTMALKCAEPDGERGAPR